MILQISKPLAIGHVLKTGKEEWNAELWIATWNATSLFITFNIILFMHV